MPVIHMELVAFLASASIINTCNKRFPVGEWVSGACVRGRAARSRNGGRRAICCNVRHESLLPLRVPCATATGARFPGAAWTPWCSSAAAARPDGVWQRGEEQSCASPRAGGKARPGESLRAPPPYATTSNSCSCCCSARAVTRAKRRTVQEAGRCRGSSWRAGLVPPRRWQLPARAGAATLAPADGR